MSSLNSLSVWLVKQFVISVQDVVDVLLTQADDGSVVHDDVWEESIWLTVGIVDFALAPLETGHEKAAEHH